MLSMPSPLILLVGFAQYRRFYSFDVVMTINPNL